jgi:hypothetical protein
LEETDFKGEIREILDELCGEEAETVQATKPLAGGGRRKKSTRRKRRSLKKKSRKQQ